MKLPIREINFHGVRIGGEGVSNGVNDGVNEIVSGCNSELVNEMISNRTNFVNSADVSKRAGERSCKDVCKIVCEEVSRKNAEVVSCGKVNCSSFKPVFALELNIFDFEVSSHIVKDSFAKTIPNFNIMLNSFQNLKVEHPCNPELSIKRLELAKLLVLQAQKSDCDILALKFNITEDNLDKNIKEAKILLKELLPNITKPLLVRGINNKSVDVKLLPALMEVLDRESIIAFADENTYKDIVPSVVKGGHILAIRTPIDINLAKEMNILTSDMGLSLDKILIDTDMGGLGYGLEYGYSIIERIKLAAFEGDKMLNMPLIAFVGEEALKVKETKSDTYSESFGDFKERSKMFEITTASAIIAAGANLVVLECPDNVKVLKSLI